MAKDKKSGISVLLGTVIRKHDSGICETDKGFKVNGKFDIGAVLVMDNKTKKVSVKPKSTTNQKNKDLDLESQGQEQVSLDESDIEQDSLNESDTEE